MTVGVVCVCVCVHDGGGEWVAAWDGGGEARVCGDGGGGAGVQLGGPRPLFLLALLGMLVKASSHCPS